MRGLINALKNNCALKNLALKLCASSDVIEMFFFLLREIKSLESLHVSLNQPNLALDSALETLSESLQCLTFPIKCLSLNFGKNSGLKLRHAKLVNYNISGNTGIKSLSDSLDYLLDLTTFRFSIQDNMSINYEAIRYMAEKLQEKTSLKILQLDFLQCQLDQKCLDAFATTLPNLKNLTDFTLNFTQDFGKNRIASNRLPLRLQRKELEVVSNIPTDISETSGASSLFFSSR